MTVLPLILYLSSFSNEAVGGKKVNTVMPKDRKVRVRIITGSFSSVSAEDAG